MVPGQVDEVVRVPGTAAVPIVPGAFAERILEVCHSGQSDTSLLSPRITRFSKDHQALDNSTYQYKYIST